MKIKTQILLAEDDPSLGFILKDNLELSGYLVTLCTDGDSALSSYHSNNFHLAILDVMLPKKDGFGIAREIRKLDIHMPILFLTARILKEDKIEGFKTGADDYITKPFSIEELLMRIEVFLKRSQVLADEKQVFTIGKLHFDYKNLLLGAENDQMHITHKEAEILKMFCESKGDILKREDILLRVWGDDDYFIGRSLDVFISKLRKMLARDPAIEILNLHGIGFRMVIKQ